MKLFRRNDELNEELAEHKRLAIEDRIARGETRADAEYAVALEFGNETLVREITRDMWGRASLDRLWKDLAFGLRILRRNPGFTAVAVLTLALGIGANTAIFSVVNGLLIRSLPFRNAKELVWITNNTGTGPSGITSRMFTYRDLRQYNHSFSDMAGYNAFFQFNAFNLTGAGTPERLAGVDITGNFFHLLGIQPALGRDFLPEETLRGSRRVTILSHAFWKARFAGNPRIVGQSFTIDGQPMNIIGVMPETFDFASVFVPGARVDLFLPFPVDERIDRNGNEVAIVGRLKPGVSIQAAQSELNSLIAEIARKKGPNTKMGAVATSLETHVTGPLRRPLALLGLAVAFVLLIACANLSNLLLARAAARRKEIALRLAIGASRWRLVRQMATESLLLSLFGGILGIPLAFLGTRYLAGLRRTTIPMLDQIGIDGRVLLFTLAISVLTGILFSLVPAFVSSKAGVANALKENTAGAGGAIHRNWTRSALIVSEIALSLMLLGGAGLMARSFLRLLDTDLGFHPEHLAIVRVDPGSRVKSAAEAYAFLDRVTVAARAIPGVESAAITDSVPLDRDRSWGAVIFGLEKDPANWADAFVRVVGPGYFETMRIPLLQGRTLSDHDTTDAQKVVVINDSLARKLFPGSSPLGHEIIAGNKRVVIGVVRDVRHTGLETEAGNEFYIPYTQGGSVGPDLVVRTTLEPEALATVLRRTIWTFAPELPLSDFRTATQLVETASSPRRFTLLLLTVFAALALLLAAVGIFGVISYSVGERTREMGIRMALGANGGMLERQVVKEALILALSGATLGLIGLAALSRNIASLLFGTSAIDPAIFSGAAIILVAIALIAAWIPARNAARIDPILALRTD